MTNQKQALYLEWERSVCDEVQKQLNVDHSDMEGVVFTPAGDALLKRAWQKGGNVEGTAAELIKLATPTESNEEKLKRLVSEGEDLFEHYELLPQVVQDILELFGDQQGYEACKNLEKALKPHGFTFDWDLSGEPFDLKPIEKQMVTPIDGAVAEFDGPVEIIHESNPDRFPAHSRPGAGYRPNGGSHG